MNDQTTIVKRLIALGVTFIMSASATLADKEQDW